jgi:hypothetical protein
MRAQEAPAEGVDIARARRRAEKAAAKETAGTDEGAGSDEDEETGP